MNNNQENNRDDSPIVILLHPDPSKGGTMHTKIIFKINA